MFGERLAACALLVGPQQGFPVASISEGSVWQSLSKTWQYGYDWELCTPSVSILLFKPRQAMHASICHHHVLSWP